MTRGTLFASFFLIVAASFARAAVPGVESAPAVDWSTASLSVEISRPLDQSISSLPRAKGDAQAAIEERLDEVLMEAISPICVDSSRTFLDVMSADPRIAGQIRELLHGARLEELFLSGDFSRLVTRFVVPFFGEKGIALPFIHTRATVIRRQLGYVPSRKYTGLLIYAKGKLPAVGKPSGELLEPALFPRIFDEDMTLVLDRLMCNPSDLAKWGMAAYVTRMDEGPLVSRIGLSPLRVAARAVFGINSTDVIISTDAVRQLLSLTENIALLQQGRIVIVFGDDQ